MKNYITVDGGTTNTRVNLVSDNKVSKRAFINSGSNRPESRAILEKEVKLAIEKLLSECSLSEGDIERVIFSGMITSEFGLYKVEHTTAPAGIAELHSNMVSTTISEVTKIPASFLGGVKTVGARLEDFNIMRGEETELMGIMKKEYGECIYILPGSHSKLIRLDGDGRIVSFISTLTGEMIAALTKHTILSSSVNLKDASLSLPALFDGYSYAGKYSINEALLKPRVLKYTLNKDDDYIYSFFLGAVLSDEIRAIVSMPEKTVVISGREEIKRAIGALLEEFSDKRVILIDAETVDASSALGAIRIYEYRG